MELVWTITGALSLDHSHSVVWSIDGAWYTGAADGEEQPSKIKQHSMFLSM